MEVKDKPYHDKPNEKNLLKRYEEHYQKFKKMASEKKIDDNPAVALAHLVVTQSEDRETQKVELK